MASFPHIGLVYVELYTLFRIAHLFVPTVASHEEKCFCNWIGVNTLFYLIGVHPVVVLHSYEQLCFFFFFFARHCFSFIDLDSKCNNGAVCMICGLLPGNIILLMEAPIKVRLWRGEVSIYSVCQE